VDEIASLGRMKQNKKVDPNQPLMNEWKIELHRGKIHQNC
jgi:hypothetical protein